MTILHKLVLGKHEYDWPDEPDEWSPESERVIGIISERFTSLEVLRERERFTSSPTFLCGNTPATLG